MLKYFVLLSLLMPITGFAQRLIIVRHGEARQNVLKIVNSDIKNSEKYSLTDKGRNQILETAKKLKETLSLTDADICEVYVSPLHRTKQTVQILIEQLGINPKKLVISDDLREIHTGDLEGRSEKDVEKYAPKGVTWDWSRAKEYGGETNQEVSARLAKFLRGIPRSQGKTVLIVTHGLPAMELLRLLVDKNINSMPDKGEFKIAELK